MTTETTTTLTIGTIDTKPERDPYTNIDGVVSRTYLKLAPLDMEVWVTQEYNDHSTPALEWHGIILTWHVPGHPTEAAMRGWIEDNMQNLLTICAGFESEWNGSNNVGRMTVKALAAYEAIETELDNDGGPTSYYETWTVESWMESSMSDITADMTDEQLQAFADACSPTETDIVLGDILEYITQHRDNLRRDAELDDE